MADVKYLNLSMSRMESWPPEDPFRPHCSPILCDDVVYKQLFITVGLELQYCPWPCHCPS